MNEKEVRDIFAEELADKPTLEAILAAQYRIGVIILAKFWTSTDDESWKMLNETTHAKCRLRHFLGLEPSLINDLNMITEVFYLYEHWLKIFKYFCDNFETLPNEFKNHWPSREEISSTKDALADVYKNIREMFNTNRSILVNVAHLPWMDNGFDWLYLAILGRENFGKFKTEFNQATSLIGKYEEEIMAPSA